LKLTESRAFDNHWFGGIFYYSARTGEQRRVSVPASDWRRRNPSGVMVNWAESARARLKLVSWLMSSSLAARRVERRRSNWIFEPSI